MASANQRKATYISHKVKFLKDQGDHLINDVGFYVSRIITAGESWIEGRDIQIEYHDLNQMIDNAVEFLCEKFEELAGGSVDVAANQLSRPSYEQSNLAKQEITGTASSSATSNRQTAALLASTATSLYNLPAVSVQPEGPECNPSFAKMAPTNQRKATFISQKLKFLKDQGDHLIGDVRLYVGRIITAGESWIEVRDKQIEYHDLNQMIDNAVEFLCEKCEELAGGSVAVAANQLSRPSCEQSNLATQVITGTASSSAKSYRQTAAPLASTTAASYKQTAGREGMETQAELVEKFAHLSNQLESVKNNISVLNYRIDRVVDDCSIKYEDINTVTDNLADKVMANTQTVQVISEEQEQKTILLRELETRLQTLEADSGRHVKHFQKQAEEEEADFLYQMLCDRLTPLELLITSLKDRAMVLDDNINKVIQDVAVMSPRLQQLDETLLKQVLARIAVIEEALCSVRSNAEKVDEQQSGIDQQLKELLFKLSESDKKHSSRFRKVKEQISEISDVQDAINEEHKTRLQSLERQLQKVSTAQDRLDKEVELQAELAEKLIHLPNQLEGVKENVDVLDARIERIIDECSIKHEDMKTLTNDLVDKVTANTHTIQVTSEGQEQKMTLLRTLETRLKTMEADSGRNVNYFQKQAEKGETNLRILCQMLSDRLTPLEQLRTSLNERASMRDDNINKLSQVIQEVAVMSPRLQQLELKASGTGCGFTAHKLLTEHNSGRAVTQYTISHSTVGNSFDADSGIFTAPFDGLYVASVSIKLKENNKLRVGVIYQQSLSKISTAVCGCSAEVEGTTHCSVGVVDLKVGDRLFTDVSGTPKSDNLNRCYFTCFLLR